MDNAQAADSFLRSTPHLYFTIFVMSIAAVIAIAGNLLIVVLFLMIKKAARMTPHIFLTNLALCDLILGLKLPLFFLVTLGQKGPWIFEDPTACLIAGVADSFAFRIVVAGMIAVAIDRYLAVIHAFRYPSLLTEKRAFLAIFVMWSYCFLWCALPVLVGIVADDQFYVFSFCHNMCTIMPDIRSSHKHKVFIATDLMLNFMLPLTVMTVCYLKIARKVLSTKQVGNTIRRFMRSTSRSLKRGSSLKAGLGYEVPKDSGVGIKIQGCESQDSLSQSDDDYIELPAITKHIDNIPVVKMNGSKTPTRSPSPTPSVTTSVTTTNNGIDIKSMYSRTGLSVYTSPTSKFRMANHCRDKRGSWTEEGTAVIKDGARKMSHALTNSVLHQLKRLSYASTAYSKMSKYQQKIARTTVVVYLSFFCCFTPFITSQVVILLNNGATLSHNTSLFIFVSVCTVYFNACINVIIYGTMHRNIRSTLRGLFNNM